MIKFPSSRRLILWSFAILIVCVFLSSSAAYPLVHSKTIENTNSTSESFGTDIPSIPSPVPKGHTIIQTISSNDRSNFTLYAVDENGNVSVINGLTEKLSKNIKIEGTPALMAFSPSREYGYVDSVGPSGHNITVINTRTNSVVGNITGLSEPTDFAVSPNGSILYVSSCQGDYLSIVSFPSGKLIGQIDVGAPQGGIALSPNGTFLYVTEDKGTMVKVYNANNYSLVASIGGFKEPAFVAFTPNGSCAYITNFGSGNVSVINTRTYQLEMNYNELYLADYIMISHNGDYAYVSVNTPSNSGASSIFSVIDIHTHQIIKNVSLGGYLGGIAVSPNCSYLYVANEVNGIITILNTQNYSIIENLTGYGKPFGVYAIQNLAYYGVTFNESGLPSGTTWYVNLSNGMDSGKITGTSYSFSLTNGTYSYTIATSDKTDEPSSPSGSLTVNGSSLLIPVAFSEVKYTVTFTESGLPSGTTWYVNLSNGMDSGKIIGTSYSFSLTNGTYSYTVSKVSGYTVSPPSGSFTISGSSTSETITYTAVSVPPSKSPSSGISGTELYSIIGVIAAVAAVGSVVALLRKKR